jgi:hypothetical protein
VAKKTIDASIWREYWRWNVRHWEIWLMFLLGVVLGICIEKKQVVASIVAWFSNLINFNALIAGL